jgi:hypothetical protein
MTFIYRVMLAGAALGTVPETMVVMVLPEDPLAIMSKNPK